MEIKEKLAEINKGLDKDNTVDTEAKTEAAVQKHLEISENAEFDAALLTKLTTTNDLCNMVNEFFGQAITDYEGCIIEPTQNPMAPFSLKVYFKRPTNMQSVEGKLDVLEIISQARPESAFDRMMNFNIAQRNKIYNLTEDGKEVLSDFISLAPGQKKVDWNKVSYEFTDASVPGRGSIPYMGVYLDLLKFIKYLYGAKCEEGYCEYQVINVRPLGNGLANNNTMIPNYLVAILRLNSDNVKTVANKLGYVSADTVGFPIVRVAG